MTLIRSRWAAVGAAVAVTFGAGGLFAAQAATTPTSVSVPVDATRVLDTRTATNIGLAGPFWRDTSRDQPRPGRRGTPVPAPSERSLRNAQPADNFWLPGDGKNLLDPSENHPLR